MLALLCSYFMPYAAGSSMVLALLGLISVIASSMELLNIYLALTPPSVILDIIRRVWDGSHLNVRTKSDRSTLACRLATLWPHPPSFGFVAFLMAVMMILKLAGSYFAFTVKRSAQM